MIVAGASALPLSENGVDGRARSAALAAAAEVEARPTSLVSYRSTGALVIIGAEAAAFDAAQRLHRRLRCTVVITDTSASATRGSTLEFPVLREKVIQVSGHLGQFAVVVSAAAPQGGVNLLQKLGSQRTHFDLVLDLTTPPLIEDELLPPGYYAPNGDAAALEHALGELPEMSGEFEKPRFFNYNPDICAHGANGLTGCTRCLDACPAGAIISMRDEVVVDPYRCQGAGACATACPTGAMMYAYPSVSDHLAKLSAALQAYRREQGDAPVLLYYDAETGRARLARLAVQLPEHVIPLEVAELGSVGMDVWLTGLAYGATRVLLLPTFATPARVLRELDAQIEYARAILQGMGYPAEIIARLGTDDDDVSASLSTKSSCAPSLSPASFAAADEKRTILRLAIEHLYAQAPAPRKETRLPEGAPFGQILVNRDACTLCMSCVGACPVSALTDGGDLPQLQFIEANCVQCGLCETTCPEDAITLAPRYLYDPDARRASRVLHEEAPFHCINCGKPFGTRKMIDRMTAKLTAHWMFQSADAMQRIQMCGDCRVHDMFTAEHKREVT